MSHKLKMLVHGYSGVGKTVLLSTALADPRLQPVLFVDVSHVEFSCLSWKDSNSVD